MEKTTIQNHCIQSNQMNYKKIDVKTKETRIMKVIHYCLQIIM